MPKKYKNIQLVKTDYDDFKTMRFFIDQEQKAEAMLKEVAEFKQSFIQSKLVSYNDWYKENVNPDADHEEIFWKFQNVHGRQWGPSCRDKNCIIFNGDIKFVAQNTTDYSMKVIKNKYIEFTFGDEYFKPGRGGFGQSQHECVMTILTYEIDTNELVKYERPWK